MGEILSERDRLIQAWDELDRAASAMEDALPRQMTEAINRLESARLAMREVIFSWSSKS